MAMIEITCRETGQAVPTGIDLDRETFEAADLSGNSFRCPACRQTHTWAKADAFLND